MKRVRQIVLIVSTLVASSLGMEAVHELGHLVGAWATGGPVTRVVLTPLRISRTDVSGSSRPLVVVWAGPVFGSLVPLLVWLIAKWFRAPGAILLRFFAGFCLVVNGLYIGLGSFGRVGDCGDMLRNGSAMWQLWMFGAFAAPLGFLLWHGEGRHFGFGEARGEVSRGATYAMVCVCLALVILGLAVDGQ